MYVPSNQMMLTVKPKHNRQHFYFKMCMPRTKEWHLPDPWLELEVFIEVQVFYPVGFRNKYLVWQKGMRYLHPE